MKSMFIFLELAASWMCIILGVLVALVAPAKSTVSDWPNNGQLITILLAASVVVFTGWRLRYYAKLEHSKKSPQN
jgi:Tfp pilus assembly protein PilO